MGKKVRKKAARNLQKEKRLPTSSPKPASQEIFPATDTVVDGDSVIKETQACPHLEKGLNLEKFSLRISSLESLKCNDCREGVADRKTKKGKNKQLTNKGSGSNLKSESITKWVCLECGCFLCGGLGFPTTPQSHAARHAKQYRHPLVLQFANPNLRWCFPCNTLIPIQRSEENGELKDILSEFVKVLKTRSSSSLQTRVDDEGIWFGRGSVLCAVKSVNVLPTLQSCSESTGYSVRGLVNLGNTCFFNSVLQNLLAVDKLRDYFLKLEGTVGLLTASLKKLFAENIPSTGARNVINPRSFFACVCAKAPQFKGFQQHDSHELLRCLLDGLCTEESRIQKRLQNGNTGPRDGNASTFVDTIFGGQISSTVSCLECGHASVVYEPYLDLSLPLPTKKSPSKTISSVSRSKKPKLPPNRQGKFRPKTKKKSSDVQSVTDISISDRSSGPTKSIETCNEQNGTSLGGSTQPESVVIDAIGNKNDSVIQNGIEQIRDSTVTSSDNDIVVSNGHDTAAHLTDSEVLVQVDFIDSEETPSWLDYLEPSTSTVYDMPLDNQDPSVTQDSENCSDVVCEDEPRLKVQESEVIVLPYEELTSSNSGNEVILSSVTSEQEPSDFDGFGGLFDEPELDMGPTEIPLSNGVEGSESDPEEVDDNDFPVSVEKCLAYFTIPELLTKTEHAWQCEQCSKSLLEQKTKLKNKLQKPVSNGGETASSDSGVDHLLSNGVGNVNEKISESADLTLANGNSDNAQDTESCSVNGPIDNCKNENSQHESDSSENEEVDSKSVKVARDASKRILISRAPRVLTIHLKRFCQDARGRLSKLNGHVNFRDTIDLKPYMDPSCCKDKKTYKYRLVGVVEHSGSMRGGHYVAYVKGDAKGNTDNCSWYHASDAYVREVSLEEVLQCEAYILFYEEM